MLDAPLRETLTLEVDCNPNDAVSEDLLQGIPIVSATKARNGNRRTLIEEWALPPTPAPESMYPSSVSANPMPLPSPSGNSTGKIVLSP
jgi:hypothetical protein